MFEARGHGPKNMWGRKKHIVEGTLRSVVERTGRKSKDQKKAANRKGGKMVLWLARREPTFAKKRNAVKP